MRVRALCALLLASFSGCAEGDPILSLKELCPELALDVCEARAGSCCPIPTDQASCEATERVRCEDELKQYVQESGLSYDALHAARQREAARDALAACDPAPSLAQFFERGFPLGATCERDAQCGSGRCSGEEPRVCIEAAAPPLCGPAANIL